MDACVNTFCFCIHTLYIQFPYHVCRYKVGYFGGAPIIMNTLLDCPQRVKFSHPVKMWTAGAPPPELTIHKLRSELNVHAQTAYGLTETYGPISTYACYDPPKQSEGMKGGGTSSGEPYTEMNRLMVQHKDTMMDIIKVLDPTTLHPIPSDGKTLGEVMVKGNIVMKGYLDNEKTTEETFKGGWFRTGDIAVCYGKGRFEIKDRSKGKSL
ncbi:hypothetical protein EON63_08635 [archaeon]|nr:MAG: hypothetical protein EON63_08635 [archaeon]